jgi:2-polyprenyl-6-hydroxyphenyl methylase/3-demethylubiquinone-9 3-methyltransferase
MSQSQLRGIGGPAVVKSAETERDPTVDEREVAHFTAMAAEWWDPAGKMRMLHRFNPVRLGYIKQTLCREFGRGDRRLDALGGLRILDIGCGAGLLSEPLARLGAHVIGADPSASNIAAARLHAGQQGLRIDYRSTTVGALAEQEERFDAVLAMEVVEHVADLGLFIDQCARVLDPAGVMIVATINRTLKSFALAILGAEYLLRWLPRGTHHWHKLVTPNELAAALERHGLSVIDETGVFYDLLSDSWRLSSDTDVNYMMTAHQRQHLG